MNTKQRDTWGELVHQCEIQCNGQPYNSIDIASHERRGAIVAAGAIVELVTPELADLLERLAERVHIWSNSDIEDMNSARAVAACIREALEATE